MPRGRSSAAGSARRPRRPGTEPQAARRAAPARPCSALPRLAAAGPRPRQPGGLRGPRRYRGDGAGVCVGIPSPVLLQDPSWEESELFSPLFPPVYFPLFISAPLFIFLYLFFFLSEGVVPVAFLFFFFLFFFFLAPSTYQGKFLVVFHSLTT